MNIHAKFLGVSSESFKNKEGEVINYKRLHIFDEDAWEYHKLPIRGEIAERKLSTAEFGDVLEIPVGMRDKKLQDGSTIKELAVVQWD